jgi:hypothetical protein
VQHAIGAGGLNHVVAFLEINDWYRAKFVEFGLVLRAARQRAGITQMELERSPGSTSRSSAGLNAGRRLTARFIGS